MGIGQWSHVTVKPGHVFNIHYNLKPGDYWIMYDQYKQEFCIKSAQSDQIVKKEKLSSLLDFVALIDHLHLSEKIDSKLMEALQKGETHGKGEFREHHIIPAHLWDKSDLIKQALDITNINMNGPENTIFLPQHIHKSFHGFKSGYSEMVIERLRDEWNHLVEYQHQNNPVEVERTVISLIKAIRDDLEELVSEGLSIRDWYSVTLFNMFKKPKKPKSN